MEEKAERLEGREVEKAEEHASEEKRAHNAKRGNVVVICKYFFYWLKNIFRRPIRKIE